VGIFVCEKTRGSASYGLVQDGKGQRKGSVKGKLSRGALMKSARKRKEKGSKKGVRGLRGAL